MSLERGIEVGLAYTLAIASAGTASLYGLMSATGAYGAVKAGGLAGVAFVACHGPAWIVKAKHRLGWPGAAFGGLVTGVCLLTSLWGGLGTNASGGAALRAERLQASQSVADDRAELARLLSERAKLPALAPTTQDAVTAAESAVASAERARIAECGIRGRHCREREADETARRGELAAALSNRTVTEAAARLDSAAPAARRRLESSKAPIDPDPQASAFSLLTGISVDTAIALNAFWLSLAFELGAMWTMLIAYSHPMLAPKAAPQEEHLGRIVAGVELIEPPKAIDTGDVRRFMLACLPRAKGQEVTWGAAYARYQRWCSEQSLLPLPLQTFGVEFKAACERAKVRTRQIHGKVYCVDVQLVA